MKHAYNRTKTGNDAFKNSLYGGCIYALIAIFGVLILATPVLSAGISVNKAVIDYKEVLKGGYAEDEIYVASDTDFDVPLSYETSGDVAPWLSFIPDANDTNATLYVSRAHAQPLKILIRPPNDIPAGNYSGYVRVLTGTINKPGGPYGSQIQAAFLIRINIEVTGIERISCNVGGLSIADTEVGKPLELSFTVGNDGNVRVRPTIDLDFWNQDQSKLMMSKSASFSGLEIMPTTAGALHASIENNLRIGQYWVYANTYPCNKSEIISFSVVEKGMIADNGELLRIENKAWAKIGETVPITAYFRNTGSRTVSAKLKGVITLNNQIVTSIDSDYYDVLPGELYNITVYFTPKKLGQYYISGRVLYNNKLSFEKGSVLNVNEGVESEGFNMLYVLVLIVIAIVILLLLIRIKRKRQRLGRL